MLFGRQTAEALAEAIRALETTPFDPAAVAERARPFAAERFDMEFRAAFERELERWRSGGSRVTVAAR